MAKWTGECSHPLLPQLMHIILCMQNTIHFMARFCSFLDQEQPPLGWNCAIPGAFSYGWQPEEEVCKGYNKYWKGMESLCLHTFGVAKVELLFSSVLFNISNAAHKLKHWQWPPQGAFLHSQACCTAKAEHPPTSKDEGQTKPLCIRRHSLWAWK